MKPSPFKYPKVQGNDTLGWFERMAFELGCHPRMLAGSPKLLKTGGVDPKRLTPELLSKATRSCLPLARQWVEKHNKLVKEGRASGFQSISDWQWFAYNRPAEPKPPVPELPLDNDKVQAYKASILNGQFVKPQETPPTVRSTPQTPVKRPELPPKAVRPVERTAGALKPKGGNLIHGQRATAVLRWCGANGFTDQECEKVMLHYGQILAPATYRAQLHAARNGKDYHGPVPRLTGAQANEVIVAAGRKLKAEKLDVKSPKGQVPEKLVGKEKVRRAGGGTGKGVRKPPPKAGGGDHKVIKGTRSGR